MRAPRALALALWLPMALAIVRLPEAQHDADAGNYINGERPVRFVADADAEVREKMTRTMLPALLLIWGIIVYGAVRLLKSESWWSVAAVGAIALVLRNV